MKKPEVVMVPPASLVAYAGNAKIHTDEQIAAVAASISSFGFRAPILTWRNSDGRDEIIAGHARAEAAKRLKLAEVPIIRCDELTDEQRRALTLADNQTTMMTGFDVEALTRELDDLADAFDMARYGFDLDEAESSLKDVELCEEDEGVLVVIRFESAEDYSAAIDAITAAAEANSGVIRIK